MKHIIHKLPVLLLCIGFCYTSGTAQDSTKVKPTATQIKQVMAYRYLNGINTEVDYEKALRLYRSLAKENDGTALNTIGTMYKNGLGVTQNNDSAFYYYQQGSTVNNGKALYNLGMMYKTGEGVEQNFEKAFEYFNRSLNAGNKAAIYSVGYFYYKGLGVTQDYTKAVEYFQKGVEKGSSSCTYMLGYSHLKGYGVTKDTTLGKQLIAKSAKKENDRAIDFITGGKIDKVTGKTKKVNVSTTADALAPTKLTKEKRKEKDKTNGKEKNIEGLWKGKLVVYDWSGNEVVDEQKLELYLDPKDNTLLGSWTQDDSISIRIEGTRNDSCWTFTNSAYNKANRRNWQIRQARLALTGSGNKAYLTGLVERYVLTTKEPDRPAFVVLEKVGNSKKIATVNDNETYSNAITVSPNPFDGQLNLQLTLTKAQSGTIEIYDQAGRRVYTGSKAGFEKGANYQLLSPNLVNGTYTISFRGEQTQLSTQIIKK